MKWKKKPFHHTTQKQQFPSSGHPNHTKIAPCFAPFAIFEIIGFGYQETNTENGLNYSSSSQQSQHNQDQVRAAARNRNPGGAIQPQPGHMRGRMMNNQQMMNNQGMMNNQMQPMNPNQVIDHDENLSDKEIYPGSMHQQVIIIIIIIQY